MFYCMVQTKRVQLIRITPQKSWKYSMCIVEVDIPKQVENHKNDQSLGPW